MEETEWHKKLMEKAEQDPYCQQCLADDRSPLARERGTQRPLCRLLFALFLPKQEKGKQQKKLPTYC